MSRDLLPVPHWEIILTPNVPIPIAVIFRLYPRLPSYPASSEQAPTAKAGLRAWLVDKHAVSTVRIALPGYIALSLLVPWA